MFYNRQHYKKQNPKIVVKVKIKNQAFTTLSYYLYVGNSQAVFLSRQDFTFITDSECERQGTEASKQSFFSFFRLELKSPLQMGQGGVLRLEPGSLESQIPLK